MIKGKYHGCRVSRNFAGEAVVFTSGNKIVLNRDNVRYFEIVSKRKGTSSFVRSSAEVAFGLLGRYALDDMASRKTMLLKVVFKDSKEPSFILCDDEVYMAIFACCDEGVHTDIKANEKKYAEIVKKAYGG